MSTVINNEVEDENEGDQRSLLLDTNSTQPSVNILYLLLLTCGIGGLQVVWSVVLSNGSPFLVSLGLSKSLTALIWIAAPLCGVVVQPVMGFLSDQSHNRWGRRRPFIIWGALGTIISMLALAWVENIFYVSTNSVGGHLKQSTLQSLVVVLATFWIYALNISIQPLQAGIRALIVENCPTHQQNQASAWASRMIGAGNVVGYLSGSVSLPEIFPSFHLAQFQGLCLIASLSLVATVIITCFSIVETNPRKKSPVSLNSASLATMLRRLIRTYNLMPTRIRKVCHIQFFAWMGWFPFMFYSTTYVAERCAAPPTIRGSIPSQRQIDQDAIRRGTFASLLFAIVALLANIALPFLIDSPRKDFNNTSQDYASDFLSRIARFNIPRAWTCGHLIFALAMFATFFVTSIAGATLLVASAGLSWALTLWAPFAIIGTEIAARQCRSRPLGEFNMGEDAEEDLTTRDEAGAIIGLHNVAVSAPQILAAFWCSGIFWAAQAFGSREGTAWVLRAGGGMALVAAWLTRRFEE